MAGRGSTVVDGQPGVRVGDTAVGFGRVAELAVVVVAGPVATGREAHDSTEGPPSYLGRDSESTLHIHVGDTILGGEYGKSNWTVDTGDKLVVQVWNANSPVSASWCLVTVAAPGRLVLVRPVLRCSWPANPW